MPTSKRLVVYGASGHGKVVAETAQCANFDVVGFADDDPGKRGGLWFGLPIISSGPRDTINICREHKASLILAIGDNRARSFLYEHFGAHGCSFAVVIHPKAIVSPSAAIQQGTVICAGAVVHVDAKVGCNTIINTSATIDHDCFIENHVHVSPGTHLGGSVCVGEGTHLGIGSTVRNNIHIGKWSVVGAGAVVVKNIPDHVMAIGIPARICKQLDK